MKHIVFIPDLLDSIEFVDVLESSDFPFHLIGKEIWYIQSLERKSLSNHWLNDDQWNTESIAEALFEICDQFNLVPQDLFLIALGEFTISLVGDVVDKVGCQGISGSSATSFRDKWVMMQKSEELGISVPETRLASTGWLSNDFPEAGIILKPRSDSTSKNVKHYKDFICLSRAVNQLVNPDEFILQPFIVGSIFFVNSIYANGQTQVALIGKYLNPLLNAGQGPDSHVKIWLSSSEFEGGKEEFDKLVELNKQIIEGFGLKNGCTHIEFFQTTSGQYVLCEGAARPAGSTVRPLEKLLLNGKYLFRVWAEFLVSEDKSIFDVPTNKLACVISFTPEGPVKKYRSFDELNSSPGLIIELSSHDEFKGGGYSTGLAKVYFVGTDIEACEERLEELCEWFDYELDN